MAERRIKLFWDMLNCANAVQTFIRDKAIEEYSSNLMLRSAVERQFEIIGEAMKRLEAIDAPLLYRITDARRIIDFRNAISHGYDGVDDAIPILKAEVEALLAEVTAAKS